MLRYALTIVHDQHLCTVGLLNAWIRPEIKRSPRTFQRLYGQFDERWRRLANEIKNYNTK